MDYRPGYQRFPLSVRRQAMATTAGICGYCGRRPATEVDHVIPDSEGGSNTLDNAKPTCEPCHTRKTAAERARGLRRRQTARDRWRAPEVHPSKLRRPESD